MKWHRWHPDLLRSMFFGRNLRLRATICTERVSLFLADVNQLGLILDRRNQEKPLLAQAILKCVAVPLTYGVFTGLGPGTIMVRLSLTRLCAAALFAMAMVASHSPAHAELSPESITGAKTIATKEAKALFVNGTKFIDVRSHAAFDSGRIPGSILIDIKHDFNEERLQEVVANDEAMVIYCNGLSCLRAGKAVKKAIGWGYGKVFYYREGLPEWVKANLPIE